MKITVETIVEAPLAEVWHAYTTPQDIMQWNFASDDWICPNSTVDLRVGGVFCSRMEAKDGSTGFDFEGTYTKIVKEELIEYQFGDRIAEITFKEKPEGVEVRVIFDPENEFPVEYQQAGWQSILDNFKRHVERLDR
ncbi:MAG: SRPBCC family protein [Anaerolineaceae bacterium]|nr:SRPBCC family protein [Anaerolineaceae bacterium]